MPLPLNMITAYPDSKNVSKAKVDRLVSLDNIFALNALAIIKLHDELKKEGQNVSLSSLVKLTNKMGYANNSLLMSYFVSFGRQALPLLQKYLLINYDSDSEFIDGEVDKYYKEFKKNLESLG